MRWVLGSWNFRIRSGAQRKETGQGPGGTDVGVWGDLYLLIWYRNDEQYAWELLGSPPAFYHLIFTRTYRDWTPKVHITVWNIFCRKEGLAACWIPHPDPVSDSRPGTHTRICFLILFQSPDLILAPPCPPSMPTRYHLSHRTTVCLPGVFILSSRNSRKVLCLPPCCVTSLDDTREKWMHSSIHAMITQYPAHMDPKRFLNYPAWRYVTGTHSSQSSSLLY